jgi:UDP-GlcNAc:undecaprenyl-phosphate GlcNAc-1-phosphate transferase
MLAISLLSFLLTLAVMRFSRLTGALDFPDFGRKVNTVPIPRLGGVGFFLAFYSALALMLATSESSDMRVTTALLTFSPLSLLFGAADDLFSLPAPLKLLSQLLISLPTAAYLTSLSPAPTCALALYLVAMMNAFNLSDGLDGLCAGTSLSSLLAIATADLLIFNTGGGVCALLLFFCVLGFIPLNSPPARLYMGDAGSETLGLVIGILSFSVFGEALPLSFGFYALPLIDTAFSILRRIASHRSVFSADRGHIHHRLLDLGMSHGMAVAVLLLFSYAISGVSLFFLLLYKGRTSFDKISCERRQRT